MNNRSNWKKIFEIDTDADLLSKKEMIDDNILLMLSRAQEIFTYKNLPDTIPDYYLEKCLQLTGHATIYKDNNDDLRADAGNLGGVLNEYFEPTTSIIANPFLKVAKTYYIQDVENNKKSCVVIRNDSYYNDLLSVFKRNATLEAETYLTMQYQTIYGRLPMIITANDDDQKKSIDEVIDNVIKGKKISAVASNDLAEALKGIDSVDFAKPNDLLNLMELSNYYKAKSYNDIGLNANFNMKREAINEAESTMNKDALLPLIKQMLKWRQKGVEEVNNFFGTNITVELSDLWEVKNDEIKWKAEILTNDETTNEINEEVINNEI